jgi:hypothetical protein
VRRAAWKTTPTFIMMSTRRLSGARKLRRYRPFSWKRDAVVRPACTTTASRAGSPVASYQRRQVGQNTKPRSWTSRSCCRSSTSRL